MQQEDNSIRNMDYVIEDGSRGIEISHDFKSCGLVVSLMKMCSWSRSKILHLSPKQAKDKAQTSKHLHMF